MPDKSLHKELLDRLVLWYIRDEKKIIFDPRWFGEDDMVDSSKFPVDVLRWYKEVEIKMLPVADMIVGHVSGKIHKLFWEE